MKDFVFIHIPKTAGTSIRSGLEIGPSGNPVRINHCYGTGHAPAFHTKNSLGKVLWDKCFTFTFVRNPWDRVLSWYYFSIKKDKVSRPALQFMKKFKSFDHWVMSRMPTY